MAKLAARWWIYILRCIDGKLYTGITTDTSRRLRQHNAGTASKFTRCRRPVRMVYRKSLPTQSAALKHESKVKALTRAAKEKLIKSRL
jgi:predicted GIY-YIG superfamily endonuclease